MPLSRFNQAEAKQTTLDDEARAKLVAYSWPGNVRQLQAVIRRAVILAHDSQVIGARHVELGLS